MSTSRQAIMPLSLPPPAPLEIHGPQAAENWKRFKRAWTNYTLATELDKKSEAIQVATLLTVIGEEAREVFATFDWTQEGDEAKVEPVLTKFSTYCQPRRSIPFERYCFNRRAQEPGETYEQYRTALRKLADSCDFRSITPDEILRDRLVFGITDDKVRKTLLREPNLTLSRTDEICRASETMNEQMKTICSDPESINAVGSYKTQYASRRGDNGKQGSGGSSEKGKFSVRECWNCGRQHSYYKRELCPAFGKTCDKCHKLNHFAKKCRSGKDVKAVEENDEIDTIDMPADTKTTDTSTIDEDADEVFPAQTSHVLDDSQYITLQINSNGHVRFQIDTGAQCNVLPVAQYKRATGDDSLTHVLPDSSLITAYGGTKLPVVGKVSLQVSRLGVQHTICCKLIDSPAVRPLLGHKACLTMRVIAYLDYDRMNKPLASPALVCAIDSTSLSSIELIAKHFPTVFGNGIGKLNGEYHIRLSAEATPVQHAPRRVPVALRDKLKRTLDEMVIADIIVPVTEPTQWISSMVVVPKKNGTLRICLDPKDLNMAIQREHYPLPTIEDIATRLHGAKLFTVLDVKSGFRHVQLDEPSSYLTTFHAWTWDHA